MTDEDYPAFSERLIALAELLNGPALSDARQLLYFGAVKALPLREVVAALEIAARRCRFVPVPAEVYEFAAEWRHSVRATLEQHLRLLHERGQALCSACQDTGFVVVSLEKQGVRRCVECAELRQRILSGETPLPQLPPAVKPPRAERHVKRLEAAVQSLAKRKALGGKKPRRRR